MGRFKLTKAQARMLQSVADGAVLMHFDGYGSYWWTERGKRLPAYGKSENFPPLPIRYLVNDGFIERRVFQRVGSGASEAFYALTDAGRAALATADNALVRDAT